jgi:hypothetical protein
VHFFVSLEPWWLNPILTTGPKVVTVVDCHWNDAAVKAAGRSCVVRCPKSISHHVLRFAEFKSFLLFLKRTDFLFLSRRAECRNLFFFAGVGRLGVGGLKPTLRLELARMPTAINEYKTKVFWFFFSKKNCFLCFLYF